MKKLIYLVVAALVCSCTSGGYTVTGVVDGIIAGDSIMIYSNTSQSQDPIASALVAADGEIKLSGKIEQEDVVVLVLNGRDAIGQFILESGDINVALGDAGVAFTGTPLNDAFSAFAEQRAAIEQKFATIDTTLTQEEIETAQEAYYNEYVDLVASTVDANKANIIGAILFATGELNTLTPQEAQARMAEFAPEILEREFMVEVSEAIEAALRTEVGQPYTDIKLANAIGDEVAVSELLAQGNYVLIDFWATWCNPCVAELPYLKEVYAQFKDKGFEIYGVSLDENAGAWAAMVQDGMPWVNVMDTEATNAAALYAVRSIPSNFLISPSGEIIAKNLRGEEVAAALSEHIK